MRFAVVATILLSGTVASSALAAAATRAPAAAATKPPAASSAARAAQPAGLKVEPGLWEFRSSLPDPLGGEAGTQVHRTCIRERTITPAVVMKRIPECRISKAVVQRDNARWKMLCETPLGPMDGGGQLRSNGTAVAGSLELVVAVGGFEIPATGTFKGRRLGNCR